MTQKVYRLIFGSAMICLTAQVGRADYDTRGRSLLIRDATYERDLQWEASADKAITPAKVIRWIMGMRGQTVSAPSATEFQPIVQSHNGQSIYVAAIAFKF
jgi:hypothetical protein